jgi:hypothetical protein
LRDMMSDMRDDDAREPGHGGMPSRPVHARLISIVSPEFQALPAAAVSAQLGPAERGDLLARPFLGRLQLKCLHKD